MKSNQTVYLNADKSKAVPEGDADARFLLVREGHELDDKIAEQYEGAIDLMGKTASAPGKPSAAASPAPQNREQAMPQRRTRTKKPAKK